MENDSQHDWGFRPGRALVALLAGVLTAVTGLAAAAHPARAEGLVPIVAPDDIKGPKTDSTSWENRSWDPNIAPVPGKKAADRPLRGFQAPKGRPLAPGQVTTFVSVDKRVYGLGQQAIANTGSCSNVKVGNPQVNGTGHHSLAEVAIQDTTNGDIVEFGWRKVTGGSVQLFGYHWDNNVGQGYNSQWVDVAGNPINLGSTITTGVVKTFCLFYDAPTTAWWAQFDGLNVAYIEDTDVSTTPSAFQSGNAYQWFHEVSYTDDQNGNDADGLGDFTCSDMGDGRQGSLGAGPPPASGNAAQFGSITLVGQSSALVNVTVATQGTIHSPAEYTVAKLSSRTFTSGGPGRNSTNTGTGSIGSC